MLTGYLFLVGLINNREKIPERELAAMTTSKKVLTGFVMFGIAVLVYVALNAWSLVGPTSPMSKDRKSPQVAHPSMVCGNGKIDPGEECDDGNKKDGDGCSSSCKLEFCGNGVREPGEQCDDGNAISGDGCSVSCKFEVCGDGVLQPTLGEQCDDGNAISGDGCSANCRKE